MTDRFINRRVFLMKVFEQDEQARRSRSKANRRDAAGRSFASRQIFRQAQEGADAAQTQQDAVSRSFRTKFK